MVWTAPIKDGVLGDMIELIVLSLWHSWQCLIKKARFLVRDSVNRCGLFLSYIKTRISKYDKCDV
jgi:hypothetical protein